MLTDSSKNNINYSLVLFLYLVSTGLIRQYAYWSVFHINIFEFVSSFEVLNLSLLSIVPFLIIFLFGTIHGVFTSITFHKEKNVCPIFYADDFKGFIKHNIKDILLMVFCSVVLILSGTSLIRQSLMWGAVAVMALTVIRSSIDEIEQKFFPNASPFKSIFCYYFIIIPVLIFCWGKYQANVIYEGTEYSYVESSDLKIEDKAKITGKLKYLGKLDKYVFFSYNYNNKLLIAMEDSVFPLELERYSLKK